MNTNNSKVIDSFLNSMNEQRRNDLINKESRKLLKPRFIDNDYNQLQNSIDYIFSRFLETADTRKIFTSLKNNKYNRIQELKSFLQRHDININPDKNDYAEFDKFYMKNADFNESLELEDTTVSNFWASILIDMTLLIGDAKIKKYPFIKWRYQDTARRTGGNKQLALYGFIFMGKKRLESLDIIEIVLRYGNRVIYEINHKNAPVLPLENFIKEIDLSAEATQTKLHNKNAKLNNIYLNSITEYRNGEIHLSQLVNGLDFSYSNHLPLKMRELHFDYWVTLDSVVGMESEPQDKSLIVETLNLIEQNIINYLPYTSEYFHISSEQLNISTVENPMNELKWEIDSNQPFIENENTISINIPHFDKILLTVYLNNKLAFDNALKNENIIMKKNNWNENNQYIEITSSPENNNLILYLFIRYTEVIVAKIADNIINVYINEEYEI
jgi:hypothetical protein